MPGVQQASSAFRAGAAEAMGVPIAVLAAGFIGYGALASDAGYSVWLSMFATLAIWALPGQLVLFEMHTVGATALAIVPAVMLTAARFLPMAVTLTAMMREPGRHPVLHYAAAHFVSMTTWAVAMQRNPDLPRTARLAFFTGFSVTCVAASMLACAAGYYVAGALPPAVRLGMIFLTPLYFTVLLVGDARGRGTVIALVCGGLAGPLLHLVEPQWSILLAGLVGGTAAYAIQRATGTHHG